MARFSEKQLQAINDSGISILVNAGAGSGKTTVLTQRLFIKLVNGVKLKDLIVVTFTKLAASEMKERLRMLLVDNLDKYPHLKEELDYIDQANIQTFDSFCNEVVKKYHYLVGIKKDFNIVNEKLFKAVIANIIDDIFNEYYESNNEVFNMLITKYTVKDDASLKNEIAQMHKKASSNNMYFGDVSIDKTISSYMEYVRLNISDIKNKYFKLLKQKEEVTENIITWVDNFINSLINLKQYDEIKEYLSEIKFPAMPRKDFDNKEEFSKCYGEFKDQVKKLDEVLMYASLSEIESMSSLTKPYKYLIESIIESVEERLKKYKNETSTYTFNDISLLAISIFENNKDIRLKYVNGLNEILIDEYQDTSPVQERLMRLLSNDNMYMVGDVKQSIYRFRDADPTIFTSTYYDLNKSSKGEVINLNDNYRSSCNVIDSVNEIFSDLMNSDVGGIDYDASQSLGFGLKKYLESPNLDSLKTNVISYTKLDENKIYSNTEFDAFIIANDIKSKVGNLEVLDKRTFSFRPCMYSDFAILTQSKKQFDVYKQVFDYMNIPLNLYKEETVSSSLTFRVLSNLLKTIYYFDVKDSLIFRYSLISVLRSFIFNLTDSQINEIFIKGNIKENLKNSQNSIYEKLSKLNEIKDCTNICDMFDLVINTFDIYENISMLDGAKKQEAIINTFMKELININNLGYNISDGIDYIDNMINLDALEAKLDDENSNSAVRMMTIHASKGLEFPVCYFPEMKNQFNMQDFKSMFIYTNDYGVICPFLDEDLIIDNIEKKVELIKYTNEEISEKIRLLYVALTRPREQIVIVTEQLKELESDNFTRCKARSYHDLLSSVSCLNKYITYISNDSIGLSKEYKKKPNLEMNFDGTFTYDITLYENKKSDVTINHLHPSKEKIQVPSKEELNLMEVGTNFHKMLEFISLKDSNYNYNHNYNCNLYINNFINTSLIRSLMEENIINDYHELKFNNFVLSNNEISGIIDLVIETNSKLVVIDYKLSNIDDISYDKQVSIYMKYLESISNKEVRGYLYSILKNEFKEVK